MHIYVYITYLCICTYIYIPRDRLSMGLGWLAGGFSWSTSLRMGLCVRADLADGDIIAAVDKGGGNSDKWWDAPGNTANLNKEQ